MSHQNFSLPSSMYDTIRNLEKELSSGENFVFLTGSAGSGRTSLCEHVVNLLDGNFTTVFIPCTKEMSLERLRQLFLQQLSPTEKWSDTEPLYETFPSLAIPVRQKLLIVIDDIDKVITTFFDEVFTLYQRSLGQNRFAFLITAHPLWAQTKISSAINDKLRISEIEVPHLSADEELQICKELFEQNGLLKLYNIILPKLPKALEACDGNLSRVIKLTETFMTDPVEVDKEQKKTAPSAGSEPKTHKKSGSTGIFISIVCVVIVLACLVPIFLGTNVLNKLFGGDSTDSETQNVTVNAPVTMGNSSDDPKEKLGFGDETDQGAVVTDDPLAVTAGKAMDVTANGPKGDKDNAVTDNGGLLPDVEGGVEVKEEKPTTKNSVTLQGEALEAIEKKEADLKSDDPRQGLAGSLNQKQSDTTTKTAQRETIPESKPAVTEAPAPVEEVAPRLITREDNALYKEKIQKEEEEKALKLAREQELAKAKEEAQKLLAQKAEQEEKAKVENKEETLVARNKSEKTVKAAAKDKAKPAASVRSRSNAKPVPGALSELETMNSSHYTLQVMAGRDRSSLLRAADYIDGKYWIYTTKRNGASWYVLITGDYANARAAINDSRSFPAFIRAGGPFAKSFDRVKSEMRIQ